MPAKSMQGKTDSLPSHSEGADLSASKYNQQDVAETAGVGHATCAVDHDVDSYHRVLTYAHKFVNTTRAIGSINTPHRQVLEPGAFSNPLDPH
eukprot:1161917-Pelagomonas_calceolata.AAC.9